MLSGGARWAVERGWGDARDLERIEENGTDGGRPPRMRVRPCQGAPAPRDGHARFWQSLSRSTGVVERFSIRPWPSHLAWFKETMSSSPSIVDRAVSGIRSEPSSCKEMVVTAGQTGIELPDRELACAPINSEVGQRYLGAMRAAINCALANREILGHYARRVFAHFFPNCDMPLLFDVSHNTCKVEPHVVDGKRRELVRASQGRNARLRARSREPARGACGPSASRC